MQAIRPKNVRYLQQPAKMPAYAREAEQSVLGGLMLDNQVYGKVSGLLSAKDFYDKAHQAIYGAIASMAEANVAFDIVSVIDRLESEDLIGDVGGQAYLARLCLDTPSAAIADTYAMIVRRKSLERERIAAVAENRWEEIPALTAAIKRLEYWEVEKENEFTPVEQLCAAPPSHEWLISKYLTMNSLALIFGDPASGKSFLAIDIACCVATGLPWRGQPVKQGHVLYIAGEGHSGLSRRFKAWFEMTGLEPAGIEISTGPIQLVDAGNVMTLVEKIKDMPAPPALIIIDTINRNFGPGDENDTADMTRAVAGLDLIRTASGASILALHHSGHSEKGRGRGSSVLHASLDMEYGLEKFDRTIQLRCTKSKDCDTPMPLAWTLERQNLPWADEEGTAINSAVLTPSENQPPPPSKLAPLGANQQMALNTLQDLYQQAGSRLEERGMSKKQARVTKAEWNNAIESAGVVKQRSYEARTQLVRRGLVVEDGIFVFLTNLAHSND